MAANWRNKLSNMIRYLGFSSCLADPDVWMCVSTNPYCYKYRECFIVHSDDLLIIFHRANLFMKGFYTGYTLKPYDDVKKCANSTTYLADDIVKFQVPDTGET